MKMRKTVYLLLVQGSSKPGKCVTNFSSYAKIKLLAFLIMILGHSVQSIMRQNETKTHGK